MRNYTTQLQPQNSRIQSAIPATSQESEVGEFINYTEINEPDSFPVIEFVARGGAYIVGKGFDITGLIVLETVKVFGWVIVAVISGVVELAKTAIVEWSRPRQGQWDGERDWNDQPQQGQTTFGNINIVINQNNNQ